MAFWNGVEKGDMLKVYNTYRKFGSADVYEAGWVKRDGKLVKVMFTSNALNDAEVLANKNKEDMPRLKRGIFNWF